MGPTRGAAPEMGIQGCDRRRVGLTVEAGRDLRSGFVTVHVHLVRSWGRLVPQYPFAVMGRATGPARRPGTPGDAADELTHLLLAARDGDRLALGAFIRSTQAEVWRMARHLVGPEDADDVTQDVFVRAWRALPDYRGDAGARTWLLAIARRACADAVRARTRRRRLRARLDAQPTRCGPDGSAADLHALISQLPTDRREAFVLTQIVGCSYAEAAVVMGVPVGTIRSRVARAREALVEAVRAADAI